MPTPAESEGPALSGNIEIITRFEHAFRAADQATIDELCDPGLVDHNPAPDHEPTLAGIKTEGHGLQCDLPLTWRMTSRTSSPAAAPSPPGGS
jgi:hypothetical protein